MSLLSARLGGHNSDVGQMRKSLGPSSSSSVVCDLVGVPDLSFPFSSITALCNAAVLEFKGI